MAAWLPRRYFTFLTTYDIALKLGRVRFGLKNINTIAVVATFYEVTNHIL